VTTVRRSAAAGEINYLVLPNPANPRLLARVRWPDVFEAISPARTDWQSDPGLFDLPYDPGSTAVTLEEADAIAAAWGAPLPSAEPDGRRSPTLIRRMPADWSNLSPAEHRAWAIERGAMRTRSTGDGPAHRARWALWRRRRPVATEAAPIEAETGIVIDLTDATLARESVEATAAFSLLDAAPAALTNAEEA
jgi:hypothetical protein